MKQLLIILAINIFLFLPVVEANSESVRVGLAEFQNLSSDAYYDYLRTTLQKEIIKRCQGIKELKFSDINQLKIATKYLIADDNSNYNSYQLNTTFKRIKKLRNLNPHIIVLNSFNVEENNITVTMKFYNVDTQKYISKLVVSDNVNLLFKLISTIIPSVINKLNTSEVYKGKLNITKEDYKTIDYNREMDWDLYKTYKNVPHYMKNDRIMEAIIDSERAIYRNPNFSPPYKTLGEIYEGIGELKLAIYYYMRYIELERDNIGLENYSQTLYHIGYAKSEIDDFHGAIKQFESVISLEKSFSNDNKKINRYLSLGKTFYRFGFHRKAIRYLMLAYPLIKKSGDKRDLLLFYYLIGCSLRDNQQFNYAKDILNKGLELSYSLKDTLTTAFYKFQIARLYLMQDRLNLSMSNLENSLEVWEGIGHYSQIMECLFMLGRVFHASGNYELALELLKEGQNYALETNSYYYTALFQYYQGLYSEESSLGGEYDSYYLTDEDLSSELQDKHSKLILHKQLGYIHKLLKNYNTASRYFLTALKYNAALGDKTIMFEEYSYLGLFYLKMKKFSLSKLNLERALNTAKSINDKINMGTAYDNLGILYFYLPDYKKAKLNFEKAIQIRKSIDDYDGLADSYYNLAVTHKKLRNHREIQLCAEHGLEIEDRYNYKDGKFRKIRIKE